MRSVGLIGGLSWHASAEYYRHINQAVNAHFGNNTNPPILLDTLDQHDIHRLQAAGRWDQIERILLRSARRLQAAGVEAVAFCANTPHKVYPGVAAGLRVPVLHIADATGEAIRAAAVGNVGLLGTRYVMEDGYIAKWLSAHYGIDTLVPPAAARERIHAIIQRELALGRLGDDSRAFLLAQMDALRAAGAGGIILGCTELPLVFAAGDFALPLFDTTRLHADKVVDFILSPEATRHARSS